MEKLNREEFEKKWFGARVNDAMWQWIEKYAMQARIEENEMWMKEYFSGSEEHRGFENRIEELFKDLSD